MGLSTTTAITTTITVLHYRFRRFSDKKVIGILKETKNRWECRAPLSPENIKDLKDEWGSKLDFIIQPSGKRIFQDADYIKV